MFHGQVESGIIDFLGLLWKEDLMHKITKELSSSSRDKKRRCIAAEIAVGRK